MFQFLRQKLFSPEDAQDVNTDITIPTETISASPGKTGSGDIDPFKATPEQLENLAKEQKNKGKEPDVKTIDSKDPNIIELPGDEEPPPPGSEEPGKRFGIDDFELDPDSEKAYLADLGPDFEDYSSIKEALLDLKQKHTALEPEYDKANQVKTRLDSMAKAMATDTETLMRALGNMDPKRMAQTAAGMQQLEGLLNKTDFDDETAVPFYSRLGNAIMQDVIPAVQGQFSRHINSMTDDIQKLRSDMMLDRFTRDSKNVEWVGREQEIKHALEMNPQYREQPNAIQMATRWIKAGKEPPTVRKQVAEKTKKKMQELEAKKRSGYLEGPGRATPPAKPVTDVEKMTRDQLGNLIDDAEKRGATL